MKSEIKVPFVNLGLQYRSLRNEIIALIDDISYRGAYILGEEVERFEKNFATYCGSRYAISVGNGGDALFLVLKAMGICAGDEVITAANSFIASAWAIAAVGATPVFVDVRDDYNLDPVGLANAVTARTKAIMPVHLTGRPAAMDEINEIARKNSLFVLEDAAQAIGARYRGRRVGSLGNAAGFSLHPLKNLSVQGDGGMITTDDDSLCEKLKKLRNHGLKNRDECVLWGHNSRLDSIQAAIGDLKLTHLEKWTRRMQEIANRYNKSFAGFLSVPDPASHEECVFHRYIVCSDRRDALQAHLLNKGVETKVNYPIPLHLQEAAQNLGYRKGSFPKTERLAETILSLPVYPELEDSQVDYVVDSVSSFFQK